MGYRPTAGKEAGVPVNTHESCKQTAGDFNHWATPEHAISVSAALTFTQLTKHDLCKLSERSIHTSFSPTAVRVTPRYYQEQPASRTTVRLHTQHAATKQKAPRRAAQRHKTAAPATLQMTVCTLAFNRR